MTPADLLVIFELRALHEGLPLDKSPCPDRGTFLWHQTENRWLGFQDGYATFCETREAINTEHQHESSSLC